MKKWNEGKSEMSSKRFLEKFLSKRKNYKNKENTISQYTQKASYKNNISDYNSINWLHKFSQKKKDKFYEKVKEDINRIKTSRNMVKKNINRNNNLINNYSNSKENSNNNFKNKKNYSNEKKNFRQLRLIKKLKEELKNNPEKFNGNLKNKKEEKIRNIKIEKIITKELQKKKHTQSFNKRKSNNHSFSLQNINKSNEETSKTIKKNLYNKFKLR